MGPVSRGGGLRGSGPELGAYGRRRPVRVRARSQAVPPSKGRLPAGWSPFRPLGRPTNCAARSRRRRRPDSTRPRVVSRRVEDRVPLDEQAGPVEARVCTMSYPEGVSANDPAGASIRADVSRGLQMGRRSSSVSSTLVVDLDDPNARPLTLTWAYEGDCGPSAPARKPPRGTFFFRGYHPRSLRRAVIGSGHLGASSSTPSWDPSPIVQLAVGLLVETEPALSYLPHLAGSGHARELKTHERRLREKRLNGLYE